MGFYDKAIGMMVDAEQNLDAAEKLCASLAMVSACVCVCVHACVHECLCACVHACVCVFVLSQVCMCIVRMYVHTYCRILVSMLLLLVIHTHLHTHTYSHTPSLVCLQCAVCIQSPIFRSLIAGEAKGGALCHLPHSHQCSDTTGREVSPCGDHKQWSIVAEWLLCPFMKGNTVYVCT